jgi:hypothetical protein
MDTILLWFGFFYIWNCHLNMHQAPHTLKQTICVKNCLSGSTWSPTHVQVTGQCLEETKPQKNSIQYSSNVGTVLNMGFNVNLLDTPKALK